MKYFYDANSQTLTIKSLLNDNDIKDLSDLKDSIKEIDAIAFDISEALDKKTISAIAIIAQHFGTIYILDFKDASIAHDDAMHEIIESINGNISHLYISFAKMHFAHQKMLMDALQQNCTIAHLYIINPDISDTKATEYIIDSKTMNHIESHHLSTADIWATALQNNRSIKTLEIYDVSITDGAIERLSQIAMHESNITHIYVNSPLYIRIFYSIQHLTELHLLCDDTILTLKDIDTIIDMSIQCNNLSLLNIQHPDTQDAVLLLRLIHNIDVEQLFLSHIIPKAYNTLARIVAEKDSKMILRFHATDIDSEKLYKMNSIMYRRRLHRPDRRRLCHRLYRRCLHHIS